RDAFASHWKDDGQVKWLTDTHIDLVRGHGRLAGPRRVAVTSPDGATVELAARHAVAMATAWRSLGSEAITVVQRGARLIPGTEPFAGEMLAAAFAARGIDVRPNAT